MSDRLKHLDDYQPAPQNQRGVRKGTSLWHNAFLRALERTGSVTQASTEVGVQSATARKALGQNNGFAARYHRALAAYHLAQAEALEQTVKEK